MTFPFTKAMDRQVDRQFRKDPNGRLVFLTFDSKGNDFFADFFLPIGSRGKAYFVDSNSDEEKIRAFVKM